MKQYETFEQAKIDNPKGEICKLTCEGFTTESEIAKGNFGRYQFTYCKASDYCEMTVEKFLKLGHKFVAGDFILGVGGSAIIVEEGSHTEECNEDCVYDSQRYILRAAALENQMNIDKVKTQTEHQEAMSALISANRMNESVEEFLAGLKRENEWNGEGLPPVGVECEWRLEGADDSSFSMCKVLMITNHTVFMKSHRAMNGRKEFALPKDAIEFRKPETQQQREDRERLALVSDICEDLFGEMASQCREDVVSTIDAMVCGGWVDKTNCRKGLK